MARVVHRLRHRLPHQPGRADAAVEPGVVAHLDDGRDAAALLADQLGIGAVEFHFAGGVRLVAELVLEPVDVQRVALAVRREARQQEAAQALRRLRQHQERVAHRRRHEPLVAVQPERTVAGRLGARLVGAQVRAALVLGHAHADQRRVLLARRHEARVVAPAIDQRQPGFGKRRRLLERRHRTIGHRQRTIDAALDLREHVGAGGARDMRARLRLGPRARMQTGVERDRHQIVPGGMKLDLVDAMAEAVVALEHWRIAVR